MSDLIDFDRMVWKVETIEDSFNDRDVWCILGTPLSVTSMRDELTWAFTKDACYSVKTTYMLGKGGNLENFTKHGLTCGVWMLVPKRDIFYGKCAQILFPRIQGGFNS